VEKTPARRASPTGCFEEKKPIREKRQKGKQRGVGKGKAKGSFNETKTKLQSLKGAWKRGGVGKEPDWVSSCSRSLRTFLPNCAKESWGSPTPTNPDPPHEVQGHREKTKGVYEETGKRRLILQGKQSGKEEHGVRLQ